MKETSDHTAIASRPPAPAHKAAEDCVCYRHPAPQSLQSKVFHACIRLIRLKQYLGRIKEKTAALSRAECPEPPLSLYRRNQVSREVFGGRNVFTLAPKPGGCGKYVLFLHGGAFVINFTKRHWGMVRTLVEQGSCTVVAPDYPLSPEHSYRERLELVVPLYRRLAERVGAENIILMGDSAGGNMCLALARKLQAEGGPQPGQIILISPWLDVTMSHPGIPATDPRDPLLPVAGARFAGAAHAGGDDPQHCLVSPLYGPLKGLGRISLFTGTSDILNPDAHKLKEQAAAEGVPLNFFEYPEMMHSWVIFRLPEARQARQQILGLIRSGGTDFR
jgi:acetyl esterase/lipase